MISVKGTFHDGVAQPDEPLEGYEGQPVIITFLNDVGQASDDEERDGGWAALNQLLEEHATPTGIGDLAHQHDHYLYGTPKQEAPDTDAAVPPLPQPFTHAEFRAWMRAQGLTSELPPEVYEYAKRWTDLSEEEKQAIRQELDNLPPGPMVSDIVIDSRR